MKKTYKNKLPKGMQPENVTARVENGHVIVDVELKEELSPEDGDFLVDKDGDVFIYNGIQTGISYGCYISEYFKDICFESADNWVEKGTCRFATEKEKSDFLEKLRLKYNMKWNPETKEVEKMRWKPKKGEYFYYIGVDGEISSTSNTECYLHKSMIMAGNCFKTEKEAIPYSDKIKEIFRNSESE